MRNSNSQIYVTGFTLIELMVTVVIVAILAGIAVPSYREHVIRANRSAAQAAMMDIANREQQFLLANRRYADTAALVSGGYTLPAEVADKYTLTVEAPNTLVPPSTPVPTYRILMTPMTGGAQVRDGELTLDSQGKKTPADKWQR